MSAFDKYIKQGEPEQAEESTLSNREMHVSVQGITPDVSKSQFDTLNCSLEELAVLKAVGENPRITQEALRKTLGKSISTVKD